MFDWIFKIAAKKSLAKGIKGGVASLAGVIAVLNTLGISITVDQAALAGGITTALLGLYEFLRNWLKSKDVNALP